MSALTVLTVAAGTLIGIGIVAVVAYCYRYLAAYAEQRAREKHYADQWMRLHSDRRKAGE